LGYPEVVNASRSPDVIGLCAPTHKARLAGLFYLGIFIMAPSGASTATPANLAITLTCDVAVAWLLYDVLRPVSRTLSMLAALFRIFFVIIMASTALSYFGYLHGLADSRSAARFDLGYAIALAPFAVHCVLIGLLIMRSIFLPRVLGMLVLIAGLAYLIFFWPTLGQKLFFPYFVIPAVLGEGSLTLWLLIMGVNSDRWREQARQSKNAPRAD